MTNLEAHPAAELFPLMEGEDFIALVADIKAHGQHDAIMVLGHQILDGRNRYRACQELGLKPKIEEWTEEGDPIEYVVSKNLHRRHLNESQRGMIAARLATLSKGDVGAQRSGVGIQIPSQTHTAKLLNISRDTVAVARKVLTEGTPEEIRAVESGEAAASTIAKQIRAGQSAPQRKRARDTSLSTTGRNPERIQRQQLNAEIWGRIRDALIHLTSLPLVTDVVAIAQAHDRTGLVDQRVEQSLKFLKDFAHEWSNRDGAESEENANRDGDADARTGDRAA